MSETKEFYIYLLGRTDFIRCMGPAEAVVIAQSPEEAHKIVGEYAFGWAENINDVEITLLGLSYKKRTDVVTVNYQE